MSVSCDLGCQHINLALMPPSFSVATCAVQELCVSSNNSDYHEQMRANLATRFAALKTDWNAMLYGGEVSERHAVTYQKLITSYLTHRKGTAVPSYAFIMPATCCAYDDYNSAGLAQTALLNSIIIGQLHCQATL
jgi:hypothetical protein